MVVDLSQGLTQLGQEVIMISPYLNNDPFNIHYIRNISINLDGNYEFDV